MARLSLDDSDKQVRDWFMEQARSIGCQTYVDEMGNLFAVLPGKNKDAAPKIGRAHV